MIYFGGLFCKIRERNGVWQKKVIDFEGLFCEMRERNSLCPKEGDLTGRVILFLIQKPVFTFAPVLRPASVSLLG